jgi:hypothetical protein
LHDTFLIISDDKGLYFLKKCQNMDFFQMKNWCMLLMDLKFIKTSNRSSFLRIKLLFSGFQISFPIFLNNLLCKKTSYCNCNRQLKFLCQECDIVGYIIFETESGVWQFYLRNRLFCKHIASIKLLVIVSGNYLILNKHYKLIICPLGIYLIKNG